MRIRQVKPSFWTDATIARLSDTAQLLYIGLWCVADDAGYLEWEVDTIGAYLRPYEIPSRRVKKIEKAATELIESGRLKMLLIDVDGEAIECGHAVIPTLPDHQRVSSAKRVESERKSHLSRGCPRLPAEFRGTPRTPLPERNGIGTVGNGKESNGSARGQRVERASRSVDDLVAEVAARGGTR